MYEKLKAEMQKRGISKYKLAHMSKIAEADFYSMLNGRKVMFPNWRKRIAEALEMSADELFDENDGKTIWQLKAEASNE